MRAELSIHRAVVQHLPRARPLLAGLKILLRRVGLRAVEVKEER
jgi:hypothetical protein